MAVRVQGRSACIAAAMQAIGERLRLELDAIARPMPERLTVLLQQLAQSEGPTSPDGPSPEDSR
jgi:hypothetical protein